MAEEAQTMQRETTKERFLMSFISQNKILPGYANFTASGLHAFTPGQRGRVAGVFPGRAQKVLEVEDVTLTAKMGYAMEDSAMLP